ncbi:hypothetical protein [Phenylobacterium montanum]|uniref:Uncharacterized protein n=1 Tax=Phenylobacterium montanum TaxID=2823693 RepID=A0A975IWI3_9CAUL|nr:hypothetical protein [Caulobacter sp. S6]QUD90107.1 hypothetical protein KCG34_09685 [Caulobacter sp. S6]
MMDAKTILEHLIALSPPPPELPETSPHNESRAEPDPDFIAARKAEIEKMCDGPVVWSAELSTHSPRWGYLWRGDFWEPKRKRQRYPTRVVCRKMADGTPSMIVSTKWGGEPPLKL